MDLVFNIVFSFAFILNTYLWYKHGRDRGFTEGVEKTIKAFEEVFEEMMEREVERDEK